MWGRLLNPRIPFPAEAGSSAASPPPQAWPSRPESSSGEGQMGREAAALPRSHHLVVAVGERGDGPDISSVGKGEAGRVAGPPVLRRSDVDRSGHREAPRERQSSSLRLPTEEPPPSSRPLHPVRHRGQSELRTAAVVLGDPAAPLILPRPQGPLLFRSRSRGCRR
jgi:hypothetical protein